MVQLDHDVLIGSAAASNAPLPGSTGTPGSPSTGLVHHGFKAMGSPCEIFLHAKEADRIADALGQVQADVARLEAKYSRYRDDSLLSTINRVALAGGEIEVDEETAALFDYANTCHRESGGLFDITSGILRRAWKLREGRLPAPEEVSALLDRIGWHRVRWESPRIRFEPGMEIDLGGVVKEYAADRAATLCHANGVHQGIVNLGGDLRVVGPRPDGSPWRIGVRHPRREGTIGVLALTEGAVASSGDYERCIVVDGVRYGHVLNPRTGWPVRHLAAVTVVGPLCLIAGSASTIAMLEERAGPDWLARLGLPHLWVDVDGNAGGPLASDVTRQEPSQAR